MAADTASGQGARRADLPGIRPSDGADAFRRVVAHQLAPQIVVSPVDLATVVDEARGLTQQRMGESRAPIASLGHDRERPVQDRFVAPRNTLEVALTSLWTELLGTHPIGIEDDFLALGGTSLVAIQLATRLESQLHIRLPIRRIIEARTIAALAQVVRAAQGTDNSLGDPAGLTSDHSRS
jgi:acyl carrier protein